MHTRSLSRIAVILILASSAIAKDVQDDFSKESGLWRFSRMGGGKGKHTLNSGRLEFSTQGASTNNDSATHSWKKPVGSYDKSWSVQTDVFLGSFALGDKNPYAGLALVVGHKAEGVHSFIRVQLRRSDKGHAFNADGYAGKQHLGSQWADTTTETATLCVEYDAASKVLTAKYDADGPAATSSFVDLFKVNITSEPDSWKMTGKDAFEFSIVSQSVGTVIFPGDMHFDNVILRETAP